MDTEEEKEKSETSLVSMGKGICQECHFYTDCPRMKGINQCYNIQNETEDKEAKYKR